MLKKILITLFTVVIGLSFVSTSLFASSSKGQKIIINKLKKPCGFNGAVLAKKHTQFEWKALEDAGKLNDELVKICPKAKPIKKKYVKHVYDFLYNYASDSGNVPSC